jgi:hypothetical protein
MVLRLFTFARPLGTCFSLKPSRAVSSGTRQFGLERGFPLRPLDI